MKFHILSVFFLCLLTNSQSTEQDEDSEDIKIWSCTDGRNEAHYDLSVIQILAQTAYELTIRSEDNPEEYVTTNAIYVLDQLRLGKSISHSPVGSWADMGQWDGTKVESLWNSCGEAGSFVETPYSACGNENGLHLTSCSCRWSPSEPTPSGGIAIYIKRNITAPIPIWRCIRDGINYPLFSLESIMALAKLAKSIIIHTSDDLSSYVETVSGSYALDSLANGMTLSYHTDGSPVAVDEWTGTRTDRLKNTCGYNKGFLTDPYWACNNHDGLQLVDDACRWSLYEPTPLTGITVSLRFKTLPPARLVRVWSCSSSQPNNLEFPISTVKDLANYATGITIMEREDPDVFVTTIEDSDALEYLKDGQSLSYSLNGDNETVTDWVGTKVSSLENDCADFSSFEKRPYWACDNQLGLHLSNAVCSWNSFNSEDSKGGIGVYLALDYSGVAASQSLDISFEEIGSVFTYASSPLSHAGISSGLLAVIVVASVVVAVILVIGVVYIIKKKKNTLISVDPNDINYQRIN